MSKLKRGKRTGLAYFDLDDIRAWEPCYGPTKYAQAWRGTAVDILRDKRIPPQDRMWVVCREEIVSARTLRLFAMWCARQVQHLMTNPTSIAALDVAERYANGEATEAERYAAAAAAGAAARTAQGDAARTEAWDAAMDAAWAAARAAALAAAWDTAHALAAAGDAAWAVAHAATAAAAGDAAGAAAGAAARAAQCAKLIEMVRADGRERDAREAACEARADARSER